MTHVKKILGLAAAFTLLSAGASFAASKACCACCDKMAAEGGKRHDMPMPMPAPAPEPAPRPAPAPAPAPSN